MKKVLLKRSLKENIHLLLKIKEYAVKAIAILKRNPHNEFTPKELWMQLKLDDKVHNSQMDVVLALWKNNLINAL